MIGWMVFYILAIPVFSFLLPMYSFWKMDDFSWGATRVVLGEKGKKMIVHVSVVSPFFFNSLFINTLDRMRVNLILGLFHSRRGVTTRTSCGTRSLTIVSVLGCRLPR